jgi:DNA-3-methyladenine glycosylase
MSQKLNKKFYGGSDPVPIAEDLLGKVLCTNFDGKFTSGIIVETEAYNGRNDNACHSHVHGKTERTKIMFGEPGIVYVYLCYGIHHLFNVVTNKKDFADAVLIRGIEPLDGIDTIIKRRNKSKLESSVGGGPGIASQALGITTRNYGEDLCGNDIWIEDRGIIINQSQISASPRVGVDYAGEDAQLPWRFRIQDNKYTSPAK